LAVESAVGWACDGDCFSFFRWEKIVPGSDGLGGAGICPCAVHFTNKSGVAGAKKLRRMIG